MPPRGWPDDEPPPLEESKAAWSALSSGAGVKGCEGAEKDVPRTTESPLHEGAAKGRGGEGRGGRGLPMSALALTECDNCSCEAQRVECLGCPWACPKRSGAELLLMLLVRRSLGSSPCPAAVVSGADKHAGVATQLVKLPQRQQQQQATRPSCIKPRRRPTDRAGQTQSQFPSSSSSSSSRQRAGERPLAALAPSPNLPRSPPWPTQAARKRNAPEEHL